jgi:DNA-binding response OmpR family regulator
VSTVCVVDDDPSVLRLLGRALQDGGMMVDLLDCGQALVRMAVARRYDLILLDLALPDLDGAELLETLRSDHPDIRVMVVSAQDDAARRVRCLDGGAIDFVGKPFDLSELLARVRAHLRPGTRRARWSTCATARPPWTCCAAR